MKINHSLLATIFVVLISVNSAYAQWLEIAGNYVLKTGTVGDCKTVGFKQFSNNQGETPNFSFECGVEEDGNIAFLIAKSKSKVGGCPEKSTFRAEFDIRKNYLEFFPFPITEACTFFETSCKTFISGSCPDNMIFVGAGTFTMGCSELGDANCSRDAEPPHKVTLSDFCIGKYEVTQKEWQEVMGSNPSKFKNCGDNCPVEQVSWNDVQVFISKLNSKTRKNYRLPTEAEWEYAARGGCQSKNYLYSGNVAWHGKNSNKQTHPVGTIQPNELGVYDMSGNVWEWMNDWYSRGYSNSQLNNPKGPSSGSQRVKRGGSWEGAAFSLYTLNSCRVDYRGFEKPDYRSSSIGFRLVHSPVEKTERRQTMKQQEIMLLQNGRLGGR
jgi:formylglycine-generating enzyme required for sulfatase activity